MENQGIDRDYHGQPSWQMPSNVLNIPNINHLPENKETHLSQIEAYCACFLSEDEEQKTAQKSLCTDQQEGGGDNKEGTETKSDTEDLESHNRFFKQWHLRSLLTVEAPKEVAAAQKPSKKEAQLSRLLSSILRHRADKLKLHVRPDGFVLVEDLLALPQLKNVTPEQIQDVVKTDEKQRYSMRKTDEKWFIRANQGHSIKSVESDELLTLVTDASAFTCCVHGTTYLAWKEIKKHGLNKMKRRHIHFSSKPFQSAEIVSGMRSTSEVLIAINLPLALEDGVLFYVSDNQVLLSEGVNGIILPCYFASVVDSKTNESLL